MTTRISFANASLDTLYSGTRYLALYTAAPDRSDTPETELQGNGYSRKAITFAAASNARKESNVDVEFDEATGTWGTATYYGICSAASGDTLMDFYPLPESILVGDGDTLVIPAGAVSVSLG